jgi:phosphate starvation-inducible PhoH-like protein
MAKRTQSTRNKKQATSYSDFNQELETKVKPNFKLDIKFKNETQKRLTDSIHKNDLTICSGPPGSGKTFLACYQALYELKNNKFIDKIVLVKSVTTLKDEEIGFLKGTMEEKMQPFVYSFVKNFEKIIGVDLTRYLMEDKIIEVLPIAYMRGINIDNAVVIIDECQNITIENIRTILSRIGENSKMVLLGDLKQIDQKNKSNTALKFLIDNFYAVDYVGVIEFTLDDIVRHPLIKVIEPIFDMEMERQTELKKTNRVKVIKQTNTNNTIKKSFFEKILDFFN